MWDCRVGILSRRPTRSSESHGHLGDGPRADPAVCHARHVDHGLRDARGKVAPPQRRTYGRDLSGLGGLWGDPCEGLRVYRSKAACRVPRVGLLGARTEWDLVAAGH